MRPRSFCRFRRTCHWANKFVIDNSHHIGVCLGSILRLSGYYRNKPDKILTVFELSDGRGLDHNPDFKALPHLTRNVPLTVENILLEDGLRYENGAGFMVDDPVPFWRQLLEDWFNDDLHVKYVELEQDYGWTLEFRDMTEFDDRHDKDGRAQFVLKMLEGTQYKGCNFLQRCYQETTTPGFREWTEWMDCLSLQLISKTGKEARLVAYFSSRPILGLHFLTDSSKFPETLESLVEVEPKEEIKFAKEKLFKLV